MAQLPDSDGLTGAGLLVVDKPAGLTSHDVVARCRKLLNTRKIGHAGTLDPMATGVLVLGVERATKMLGLLTLTTKAYTATIRLGQASTTDDAEGELLVGGDTSGITAAALEYAIGQLTGAIQQVPATVSAIKVDGQRAHARVRAGEQVDLAARAVTVTRLHVCAQRKATTDDGVTVLDLDVAVECSSGTYVRALARDLGSALGVGGHGRRGAGRVRDPHGERRGSRVDQPGTVAGAGGDQWGLRRDQPGRRRGGPARGVRGPCPHGDGGAPGHLARRTPRHAPTEMSRLRALG
jgi:tRNA pseudouridine55 synthase